MTPKPLLWSKIEPVEHKDPAKTSSAFLAKLVKIADSTKESNLSYMRAWEDHKKFEVEHKIKPQLKKIEEQLEKKKAEYAEKMKNKVAVIHKKAEERRAKIEAKYSKDILEAKETDAKYGVTGILVKLAGESEGRSRKEQSREQSRSPAQENRGEQLEKKKAEYAEKMKKKVAPIDKKSEEIRAGIEAEHAKAILDAKEDAAKYRAILEITAMRPEAKHREDFRKGIETLANYRFSCERATSGCFYR